MNSKECLQKIEDMKSNYEDIINYISNTLESQERFLINEDINVSEKEKEMLNDIIKKGEELKDNFSNNINGLKLVVNSLETVQYVFNYFKQLKGSEK